MPGDRVVYFYIPLTQLIEASPGPHVMNIDAGNWLSPSLGTSWRSHTTGDLSLALDIETVADTRDAQAWAAARAWEKSLERLFPSGPDALRMASDVDDAPKWPTLDVGVTVVEAAITLPPSWAELDDSDDAGKGALLTAALECALEGIRNLLLMFYQFERRPFFVPTLETIPMLLPYMIAQRTLEGIELENHGLFLNTPAQVVHDNRHHARAIDPSYSGGSRGIFTNFLSLRNETDCLLHLGQYRASLIMAAASAESLVDSAIKILLWEAGSRPEDVASEFGMEIGIGNRARRNLPMLLKGNWGTKTKGILADWEKRVVFPRNLATHQGTSASRSLAFEAAEQVDILRRFIGGRIFENFKRYPVAAMALVTELAMSPRRDTPPSLARYADRLTPQKHLHRLEGWLVALDRIVMDAQYPCHPSMKTGGCICVELDSVKYYAWHDWTTGKARTLGEVPSITPTPDAGPPRGGRAAIDPRGLKLGPWVEEHNLVPGLQVLSNRDDIRDYLWRQSRP